MTTQSVQVKLELGHRATFRDKPTPQGFTHDWVVFVRGPGNEGSIHHFVDKVVFQLHESFPKARRVVKDSPFQVAEAGYAGFLMPIEVYFKNKEEPKKVIFQYDLFLHLAGQPPVNHIRCEKLTFNNPTEDFRRKLIKAGGVGILENDSSPSHNADKPSALSTYKPHSSVSSIQYNKTEPDDKYSSTSGKPQKPIKEHHEVKTAWKEPKAASKGPKSASKEPKSASKEPKSASKESKSTSKEPKSASKDLKSTSKEPKSNSKVAQKPSGKRPPSSSPPPSSGSSSSQDGTKKRKKSTSAKDKNSSSKQGTSDKSSEKQSSGEKSKGKSKSSKSKSSSVKQNSKRDDDGGLFAPEIVVDRRKSKSDKKEPPKTLPPFEAELSTEEKEADDDDDMDVPSPSSSISFSSLPRGGGKGALSSLMHEIDENDDDFDDQDIVTPFPTDFSNHHSVSNSTDRDYGDNSSRSSSAERDKEREKDKEKEREKDKEKEREKDKDKERGKEKSKSKEKGNSRKGSSSNGPKKKSERKSRNSESSSKSKSQSNHDYLTELVLLHRKLMSLRNREQIQRIVDLIGDTDHFQISDNSFDFDLCSLDKTTVKKLQECVAPL